MHHPGLQPPLLEKEGKKATFPKGYLQGMFGNWILEFIDCLTAPQSFLLYLNEGDYDTYRFSFR